MVHSDSKGRPSSFVNQLRLDAIRKVSRGFLGGALVLKTAKGTRTFAGVPRVDSKILIS